MVLSKLQVVLTKTFDGKPLAVVRNLPGLDAEFTPAQLRALSAAFSAAAEECEAHKGTRTAREYAL